MDNMLKDSIELIANNYYIILGIVILIVLYLNESCTKTNTSTCDASLSHYGYDQINGPNTWRDKYPHAAGIKQSPVNLVSMGAITIPSETMAPLVYSDEYHLPPCEMRIHNSGHNVVVYARWPNSSRPTINGGPIAEDHEFLNMRFRWGPNDDEGSEHMVDSRRFAMEIQVCFVKACCQCDDMLEAAKDGSLLIISYFFMITPIDNPFMEPIISNLHCIKEVNNCVSIEPIPLTLMAPTFSRHYYSYIGSLSYPPCTEGVRWIIQPEPLAISSQQVRKFRKLNGFGGPILDNSRPVQKMNNRDIFYYD